MRIFGGKHWISALGLAALLHLVFLLRFGILPEPPLVKDRSAQAINIALAPKPTIESAEEPATKQKLVPVPEPEPKAEPKPKPAPSPVPKPVPQSVPKPAQPPPQKPPSSALPNPERVAAVQTTSPPADNNSTSSTTSNQSQSETVGKLRDAPADYRATLGAWLARHKNYPRRARRLHQEGTVVLHVVMDRNGRVLEWKIRSSSGSDLLDTAVEEMIKRANPLPALPDTMTASTLEFSVPVNFALR